MSSGLILFPQQCLELLDPIHNDWGGHIFDGCRDLLTPRSLAALEKNGGVRACAFAIRTAIRIIVSGRGSPRTSVWRVDRRGMAVQAPGRMRKQNRSAENRLNFRLAFFVLHVPQFERAAVGGQPILVEIGDKNQAIIELRVRMPVKIDVHREFPARGNMMQAASAQPRVCDEPLDTGNFRQKIDEYGRMDRVEIEFGGMTEAGKWLRREFLFIHSVENAKIIVF